MKGFANTKKLVFAFFMDFIVSQVMRYYTAFHINLVISFLLDFEDDDNIAIEDVDIDKINRMLIKSFHNLWSMPIKNYLCTRIFKDIQMRHLFKAATLLCLLLSGNLTIAQQVEIHAVITKTDSSQLLYDLDENDRISFPNDEILVITQNGTDIQIPISEIRKVTFDEILATNENEAENISIFPNPVSNTFTITGINDFQQLSIYSIDGRLVKHETVSSGQSIDISELPQGLYYANINKQNFKLIKL